MPSFRPGMLAVAAAVAGILLLTLWPIAPRYAEDGGSFSLRFGLADAVRNVILFVPLGIALGGRGAGAIRVALCATALSAAIELAQVQIPGRYGNAADLVSNVAGALVGSALVRSAPRWLWPGRSGAIRLGLVWSIVVAAILLGTGVLLAPALPPTEYYAGWTLDLGHLDRYTGRVSSAHLGAEPLPNGRLAHSDVVRHLWLDGVPLRVDAVAGERTTSLAPIFSIHDDLHREIVLLGAERGDLVLRVRTRAQAVSLDRPGMRWPGVLDDVRAGEPIALGARREGNGWCLSLGERSACPIGFSAGSGWRLVWFPQSLSPAAGPWLNAAWLAALFVPLGLWLRASLASATAVVIAVLALLATPLTGLLPPALADLAASATGIALGVAMRAVLGERSRSSRLALTGRPALPS
ncbi:MAG: VanZ family protein [Deltaproteobacteria bacterium]|nr:VanZ family protein [Deltaproteobacteria bacterium]